MAVVQQLRLAFVQHFGICNGTDSAIFLVIQITLIAPPEYAISTVSLDKAKVHRTLGPADLL